MFEYLERFDIIIFPRHQVNQCFDLWSNFLEMFFGVMPYGGDGCINGLKATGQTIIW